MRICAATTYMTSCPFSRCLLGVFLCFTALCFPGVASAQDDKAGKDEAEKPRAVELVTKDGMKLSAAYFPSNKGKDAKTVLLVHEWRGQSSPYKKLVFALREAGCGFFYCWHWTIEGMAAVVCNSTAKAQRPRWTR